MENVIEVLKKDKTVYVVFGISLLILFMSVFSYFSNKSQVKELLALEEEKISENMNLRNEADVAQAERRELQKKASQKTTGFNLDNIVRDTEFAKDFFAPAFTWDNGDDYDEIRESFIEELGEKNTFTKTYLEENAKTVTGEGKNRETRNYIDEFDVKMEFGDIDIIPLSTEGTTISYIGFVSFYPYTEEKLHDTTSMETGHAIIKFAMMGEDDKRKVTNVEAWGGTAYGFDN